jgi:hypothetical protein
MAEQQFKGDNNADLVFTTLWARPDAWFSFFLQLSHFPLSLDFLLQIEAILDLLCLQWVVWLDGRLVLPFLYVQSPK